MSSRFFIITRRSNEKILGYPNGEAIVKLVDLDPFIYEIKGTNYLL